MENFFKIRADKQYHIINAAFTVFGRQGYRKASMADIAQEAGITKGMITYYFGSKKTLYMYLVDICRGHLMQQSGQRLTDEVTDFFERVKISMDIQISAMKEHPALLRFAASFFYESDPEVASDTIAILETEYEKLYSKILSGADLTRFKPGFDPMLICKFVLWADDGFMTGLYESKSPDNIDAQVAEFHSCLDIMKKTFYKENA